MTSRPPDKPAALEWFEKPSCRDRSSETPGEIKQGEQARRHRSWVTSGGGRRKGGVDGRTGNLLARLGERSWCNDMDTMEKTRAHNGLATRPRARAV